MIKLFKQVVKRGVMLQHKAAADVNGKKVWADF